MSKLLFFESLKTKLENVSTETINAWNEVGISSVEDINERIMERVNRLNKKFDIKEVDYKTSIQEVEESSTYFGVIQNEGVNLAYVFVIPPQI